MKSHRTLCWSNRSLLTLLFSAASICVGIAAPANDNIANATLLNGDVFGIPGTTVGATTEAIDPTNYVRPSTVWYRWTPTTTGRAKFVMGERYYSSAALDIFHGETTALKYVGGTSSSSSDSVSLEGVPVKGGVTYWICANTSDGSNQEAFVISAYIVPGSSLATQNVTSATSSNHDITTAQEISGWNVTSIAYASDAPQSTPYDPSSSYQQWVWWYWTAPNDGVARLNFSESSNPGYQNTTIAVFRGRDRTAIANGSVRVGGKDFNDGIPSYAFATKAGQVYTIGCATQPYYNNVWRSRALNLRFLAGRPSVRFTSPGNNQVVYRDVTNRAWINNHIAASKFEFLYKGYGRQAWLLKDNPRNNHYVRQRNYNAPSRNFVTHSNYVRVRDFTGRITSVARGDRRSKFPWGNRNASNRILGAN